MTDKPKLSIRTLVSDMSDAFISEIDSDAAEWTDGWAEWQLIEPTKQEADAMFIRRAFELIEQRKECTPVPPIALAGEPRDEIERWIYEWMGDYDVALPISAFNSMHQYITLVAAPSPSASSVPVARVTRMVGTSTGIDVAWLAAPEIGSLLYSSPIAKTESERVLRAIVHAVENGQDPKLILDENSPLMDEARALLQANGATHD